METTFNNMKYGYIFENIYYSIIRIIRVSVLVFAVQIIYDIDNQNQ